MHLAFLLARVQGVANRDIKLENTLLDGSPRPLIKVRQPRFRVWQRGSTGQHACSVACCLLACTAGIAAVWCSVQTECWRHSCPTCSRCTTAPCPEQICDFGYSKHEKYQSAPGSRVGTPAYLAPEVIMTTKGKTYDGKVCWGVWWWGWRVQGGVCSNQPPLLGARFAVGSPRGQHSVHHRLCPAPAHSCSTLLAHAHTHPTHLILTLLRPTPFLTTPTRWPTSGRAA